MTWRGKEIRMCRKCHFYVCRCKKPGAELRPAGSEVYEQERQLRRQVHTAAAELGWFPEDLEKFTVAHFDHNLAFCSVAELEFLLDRFEKGGLH